MPRDASHRNYKDPSAKPELLCALGRFEALCGFREPHATRALFADLARLGATELEPNDPFSFTQLSVICQRCGKIPEAEAAMDDFHSRLQRALDDTREQAIEDCTYGLQDYVNYFGAVHTCRAVLPSMVARKKGHVLNVASMAGLMNLQEMGPYNVTKAGVIATDPIGLRRPQAVTTYIDEIKKITNEGFQDACPVESDQGRHGS